MKNRMDLQSNRFFHCTLRDMFVKKIDYLGLLQKVTRFSVMVSEGGQNRIASHYLYETVS
jgi:hypothetical protein